jgi:hypothetical protein
MKNIFYKNRFLLSIGFAFFTFVNVVSAQQYQVKGIVADTSKQGLEFASVILLKAKDSTLLTFATTDARGAFELKDVPAGRYRLKVTYVGLETLRKEFDVSGDAKIIDIGMVEMYPKGMLEVLVKGYKDAVKINKDTIEFNAGSFKVQPNATVEDLLKRLPGVEVDKQGAIKANGEQVVNVLVDGKPFFGKDPKMATKNLPADAIDKIQVFDKKSDQSQFTGIDDGDNERTINVKLRADKKKGSFGKIEAGSGTSSDVNDTRYGVKGNYNKFSQKKQFALLGMANNVSEQGFSFENYMNFTGESQRAAGGGGGMNFITANSDDLSLPISNGDKTGFADTYAGGVNYSDTFGKNTELNSSYSGSDIQSRYDKTVNRQSFVKDKTLITNEVTNQLTDNINHKVNVTIDQKIDSFNSVKLNAAYSIGQTNTKTKQNSNSFYENNGYNTNDVVRDVVADSKGNRLNADMLFRHKFRKKGRTFSLSARVADNQTNMNTKLDAQTLTFNNPTSEYQKLTIRQQQSRLQEGRDYGGNLSFTEMVAKKKFLELTYRFSTSENHSDRKVYDIGGANDLTINPLLTNEFRSTYQFHRPGMNFRMNGSVHKLTLTAQYQVSKLEGNLISKNQIIRNNNNFFLPSVRYRYDISQSKNMTVDYETSAREPSITQLQPVVDNSDPLNISVGNPNLRPEFRHNVRARFSTFNSSTFQNFFVFSNFTYTQHKIVSAQTIAANLARTSMPVNVDQDFGSNIRLNYGKQLIPQKLRFNSGLGFRYSQGQNLVNDVLNLTKTKETSFRTSFNYDIENKFSCGIGGDWSYQQSVYSLQSRLNQKYWNHEYSANLTGYLPKGFVFNSDAVYNVYTGRSNGYNANLLIWNADISKTIFKNKKGVIKLMANDLLNQNQSFRRTTQLNYVQDERINALGRYWQLQFIYRLNTAPMGDGKGGRGMRMRMGN